MASDIENYFSPLIPDDQREGARNILARAFRAARSYDGKESSENGLIERLSAFEECARELAGTSSLDRDALEGVISAQMLRTRRHTTVTALLALAIESFGKRFDADILDIVVEEIPLCFLPTARHGGIITRSETALTSTQFEPRTRQLIVALNRNGVYADDLVIYRGIVEKWMLRKQPYSLIQIPRLNREVVICDQVGEAVFVGHGLRGPLFWATHGKEQLEIIPDVTRVINTSNWIPRVLGFLLDNNPPSPKIIVQSHHNAPKKEEHWTSNYEMASIYVGGGEKFKKLFESYAESLRLHLMEQGKTSQEASIEIEKHFVGIRTVANGHKVLCASLAVIAELEQQGRLQPLSKKAPEKEQDWLSNIDMTSLYVGSSNSLKQLLESYAAALQQKLVAEGKTTEEVAVEINKNFVGIRTPGKGKEAVCANPAVIAELEQRGELRRRDTMASKKEPEWLSYNELVRTYVGSGYFIKGQLASYADELRQSLTARGKMPEEAAKEVDELYVGLRTAITGREAICASPAAVIQLEQQGKLRRLDKKAPRKETDWLSYEAMSSIYIGDSRTFKRLFEIHAENLCQALIAQGKTLEEAAPEVSKHCIGFRTVGSGKQSICASPIVIAEFEKQNRIRSLNKKAPPKEAAWRSYKEIALNYIGGHKIIKRILEVYAVDMSLALMAQGQTPEIAAAEVDKWHVGNRTVGPHESLCASPATIAELELQGRFRSIKMRVKEKEADWLSNSEASFIYVGDSRQLKQLFESRAESLRRSFMAQGKTSQEAVAEVDKEFVGNRTSTTGSEVICASPGIIAEFEQEGKLRRLDKKAPRKETDWLSNEAMSSIYIGDPRTFKRLFEIHAEGLRQTLIAQGKTPEEAAAEVDNQYVGLRSVGSVEPLCASPHVIAELEKRGKLRQREVVKNPNVINNSFMGGRAKEIAKTARPKSMIVSKGYTP